MALRTTRNNQQRAFVLSRRARLRVEGEALDRSRKNSGNTLVSHVDGIC
jgi:hypothetical protein